MEFDSSLRKRYIVFLFKNCHFIAESILDYPLLKKENENTPNCDYISFNHYNTSLTIQSSFYAVSEWKERIKKWRIKIIKNVYWRNLEIETPWCSIVIRF